MSIATERESEASATNRDSRDRVSVMTPGKLVIVGGGMAGFGLCDRLVRSHAIGNYRVTLFGEEPSPAYDRVNLSKLFDGREPEDLQLADRGWYEDNQIELRTGCRIVRIDRARREVIDQKGIRYGYDQLVLATGSRPRVPPIPGADSSGVFVYRTLSDLEEIRRYIDQSSAKVGAVIGGGLLGLEAAKVLMDLGLKTSVIEMAPGLMPRQLDAKAAALLRDQIESIGVDVHLVRRTESIECRDQGLTMRFANADPLDVDILIIAAGVVPNDELAKECGLQVAERGGIVVDGTLQTTDPNIFAIGECVSFRDHIYGLVAPCYRMADILADRLASGTGIFHGADESAELKLLGVTVAALGQAIGESPAGITLTQSNQDGYRKLILSQGCIVGAACVGEWDELAQIRQAVHKHQRLWPWQRRRFRKTGSPWIPGGVMPVVDWPQQSIVCSCHEVTKGDLQELINRGVTDPGILAQESGASTACGSCRSLVCELAGKVPERVKVPASTSMLWASVVGAIFVLLLLILPPIPLADSVQSGWRSIDVLWRSDFAKQVTGFTLLGLLIVGLLFSLRKRVGWFHWGSYGLWRSIHGILGTAVLVAVAIHTGLRLGHNLNLVLSLTFIVTAALGTLAGMASSLESSLEGTWAILVRRWRPRLTKIHLWLFWPLPLLIALHIFSFYWFDD